MEDVLRPDAGCEFGNMFSDFTNTQGNMHEPETASDTSAIEPYTDAEETANPLLAFLSPEQLELYNSILFD